MQALNDEVALRIGLAAKELDGVDTQALIKLLIRIMGEPITQAKLSRLRAKKVRSLGGSLLGEVNPQQFEQAFAMLKGRGIRNYLYPKPEFEEGIYCEINGVLSVACASNRGENIDAAFADCIRFLIYHVSPDYVRLIDVREPSQKVKPRENSQARAALLRDCALLYSTNIGSAAAAKVVNVGIHPVTLKEVGAVVALEKLQRVISQENPPPWLLKAMGKSAPGKKSKRV